MDSKQLFRLVVLFLIVMVANAIFAGYVYSGEVPKSYVASDGYLSVRVFTDRACPLPVAREAMVKITGAAEAAKAAQAAEVTIPGKPPLVACWLAVTVNGVPGVLLVFADGTGDVIPASLFKPELEV